MRYLYSTSELPHPRESRPALTGSGHYVYELKQPLPRAFFAGRARWLPHGELHRELKTLAGNGAGRITLGPEVLLEGTERTEGKPIYAPALVTSDRGRSVEVSVAAPTAGFLVLSDVDLPGWSATVDGRPSPIYKANGFARAVRVPAGGHTVEFEYSPAGLTQGATASGITAVLSVAVLLGTIFGPRIRRRHQRPPAGTPETSSTNV